MTIGQASARVARISAPHAPGVGDAILAMSVMAAGFYPGQRPSAIARLECGGECGAAATPSPPTFLEKPAYCGRQIIVPVPGP